MKVGIWPMLGPSDSLRDGGVGGRGSEKGKGGRVFPAKVVTMVMGQDHAWGEAAGQPKLKEDRFP